MAKFASEDEEVKLLIFKERQDSAAEDFDAGDPDAWKKKLEYKGYYQTYTGMQYGNLV